MMKVIIFGVNGQDGYFLSRLLEKQNIDVIGTSRSSKENSGNVADYAFVEYVIRTHKPDYVFHFAANSTTHHSALFDNHNAICTGTLNILESVKIYCPHAKVFLSGSAMQFENNGLPIDEKTLFQASSSYSVARIQSVYAGRYYRDTFGLQVYTGYFFNHDSPLRSERHVNQKIAAAARRIFNGSGEKLELGNISVQKEFNFAGDVVEAVWMLVNQNMIYEAVIGSGISYSIKDWLEYCFNKLGVSWQEFVVINQNYLPDYQVLVSNPQLIKNIGWKSKVDFYELADMMLEQK